MLFNYLLSNMLNEYIDVPKISLAESLAKSTQIALPKFQFIGYDAELHETAKYLAAMLAESPPLSEQLQEVLRSFDPTLKKIELETTAAGKQLTVNLQLFSQFLEDTALYEDDPHEDYVREEVIETLSNAIDLTQKVLPADSVEAEALHIKLPKKMTIGAIYNLVMLLLTVYSIYLARQPDAQLEQMIELQQQEIEILQETSKEYQDTLAELNQTLVLLTEQLAEYPGDDEDCYSPQCDMPINDK